MDARSIVSQLQEQKILGFRLSGIEVWGRPLVRPDDTSLELSAARVRGDLLVLTLTPTAADGGSSNTMELVVEEPGQLSVSKDALEISSATYLRFQEMTLTLTGSRVQFLERGRARDGFDAKGSALILRRDLWVS
jgi:hypothetical protein